MGFFGNKQEEPENEEPLTEDEIAEELSLIYKQKGKFSYAAALDKVNVSSPDSSINFGIALHNAKSFKKEYLAGIYQIITALNYPLFPGDIVMWSNSTDPKKGDLVQIVQITEEESATFHLAYFQFKNPDGDIVIKSVLPDDKKKYTISNWSVLGKLVHTFNVGSEAWKEICKKEDMDAELFKHQCEEDLKFAEESENIVKKSEVIAELKRRIKILEKL